MTDTPTNSGQVMPSRGLGSAILLAVNFLRTHGLNATLQKVRTHVGNAFFDVRYGVHSNKWVPMTELTVVGDNKAYGTFYSPIKPLTFKAAMDTFKIPREGVFVDLGAGAGRALMLAVLNGFESVVGVEYATNLCPIAEMNLGVFRRRTDKEFDFRIVNIDAGDYAVGDDDCVFFLFNPFGRPVLERVLANIRRSYESSPRPIHLIYGNPVQREALDDNPFWLAVDKTGGGGFEEFVYYRVR